MATVDQNQTCKIYNLPEFTARAVREWLGRVGARTLYI